MRLQRDSVLLQVEAMRSLASRVGAAIDGADQTAGAALTKVPVCSCCWCNRCWHIAGVYSAAGAIAACVGATACLFCCCSTLSLFFPFPTVYTQYLYCPWQLSLLTKRVDFAVGRIAMVSERGDLEQNLQADGVTTRFAASFFVSASQCQLIFISFVLISCNPVPPPGPISTPAALSPHNSLSPPPLALTLYPFPAEVRAACRH